ncbi:MAG: alpha-L-glutamate ligase [Chloroflexi bacterium]|nr:alpha-L-glutamate ligase [Chloroflexota bacterium]
MILFAGIPSEPPLALAIAAAQRQRVAHRILNQRDTAYAAAVLAVRDGAVSGMLELRDGTLALETVTGVYHRLTDPEVLPEARRDPHAARQACAAFAILSDWLEMAPARVLNRAAPSAGNASKPAQALQLARLGWAVPATLVSSDPEDVLAFRAEHGRVIFKSASGVRSIVTELTPADLPRLWQLRALPTQFQALVEGTDVRVHVVGARVFATEVRSRALDYRYAARFGTTSTFRPIELPAAVEALCRTTAAALDLPLCGIDLRRRPDGTHVCFEVNPAPAYSWYEENTGQPIADAIVTHLVEG